MTGDRPPDPTATEAPPSDDEAAKNEAPANGVEAEPAPEPAAAPAAEPVPEPAAAPAAEPVPEAAPAAEIFTAPTPPADAPQADGPKEQTATQAAAVGVPEADPAAPEPEGASGATAPVPEAAPKPKPKPKRPPRPREPLPWPELRAAAGMVREDIDIEELKELFRHLPGDVREETVDGVREYRKGARRPVSAYAGKALARAVHTARRARRRPDSDEAVSDAIGHALAAEVIASLDVEIAAEVILPKRDLLERESKNARRRQKAEDDKSRDERRRRAREESGQQGTKDGTYSGAKIRGLDQLAKLFGEDKG